MLTTPIVVASRNSMDRYSETFDCDHYRYKPTRKAIKRLQRTRAAGQVSSVVLWLKRLAVR